MNGRLIQSLYHPFYALNHFEQNDEGRYYHVKRNKEMAEFQQGYEYQVMFVDKNRDFESGTVSMSTKLLCTNRDLPSQVLFGQSRGDLFSDEATGFTSLSFLQQPTKTSRFKYTGEERWRLISLMSLNLLSLASQNASLMKEFLSLYDMKQSPANKKLIEGIIKVSTEVKTRRIHRDPQPGYIRGTLVKITIDVSKFSEVSIRQFAHLLSCVFGYHASLNSFVELVLINVKSKEEIHRCQPQSGLSPLI